jgi:CRP/FNR family cyclic AMP-dependent transcriptional regulator
LLARFEGAEGRRRLIEALAPQAVIRGNLALAEEIADVGELLQIPAGAAFIEQASWDCDVFLILVGKVAIEVNGLEVATRPMGTHVGEMAAIDPTGARSATVRALEQTVLVKLTEPQLASLGEKHPDLWRRFAVELAARLRQRSRFIRVPNEKPRLFIGSSTERLSVAQKIQSGLSHDNVLVEVWTDGVFQASDDTLSSLMNVAENSDFGVLVLGSDDVVIRRGDELNVPRDNVIFELGLFIGAVGRNRTFIVKPRDKTLALPTDLLGITPIDYAEGDDSTLTARIAPVCTQLRSLISTLGVK